MKPTFPTTTVEFTGTGGPFTRYGDVSNRRYRYGGSIKRFEVDDRDLAGFVGTPGSPKTKFRVIQPVVVEELPEMLEDDIISTALNKQADEEQVAQVLKVVGEWEDSGLITAKKLAPIVQLPLDIVKDVLKKLAESEQIEMVLPGQYRAQEAD